MKLDTAGIDLVDVSTGGTVAKATILVGAGYQLPFASAIKRIVEDSLLVGAVGLITSPQQAETILLNSDADFVLIAREFLRNPYFPLNAPKELRSQIPVLKP